MKARRIDYDRLACWEWLPVFREDEVAALLGISARQVERYRVSGMLERVSIPPPRKPDGTERSRSMTTLYSGASVRRLIGLDRPAPSGVVRLTTGFDPKRAQEEARRLIDEMRKG